MKPQFHFFGRTAAGKSLISILPLNTPLSLHVDPSNLCNLKCLFCPTGHPEMLRRVKRKGALMSMDMFSGIINDLKQFPSKLKRLHLYKDGEPFLNPGLPDMIKMAKSADISDSVETTTNGLLLTPQLGEMVAVAGLDRIRISIQATNRRDYLDRTGADFDFTSFISRLGEFFLAAKEAKPNLSVHVKTIDFGMTEEARHVFVSDFADKCDELHIDSPMGWTKQDGFDFNLGMSPKTGMDGTTLLNKKRLICPLPFYTMSVNSSGAVSACCVDWSHDVLIGNCLAESLVSVWNGPRMAELRKIHIDGNRHMNTGCASCAYIHGLPEKSDLDSHASTLKGLFSDANSDVTA